MGVIQFFNKTAPGMEYDIDPRGFNSEDRRALGEMLQDVSDAGLAIKAHYFQSTPDSTRFLGLQDELNLENAVIMSVDLTRSSSFFSELSLIDAARMINRFNEHVYQRMGAFSSVVERFNGDGTLIRFHYGGFESNLPASNPAYRAVCSAADLLESFDGFKLKRWNELPSAAAGTIKLRITIALGPVISTNAGPRQFQAPTVIGPCVNRSVKMVAHAPRDRDVVLVDDNVRKALMQISREQAGALSAFSGWTNTGARQAESLMGHQYFEVAVERFRAAAAEIRQRPQRRTP